MGGDPDFLRTTYYIDPESPAGKGMQGIIGWSDRRINALAQAQALEMDPVRRKKIIFELQERIADEVPMVLLVGVMWNNVFRPAKYDGWVFRYGHNMPSHNKLSFLIRE
jgi:peptide/nickel transport system substrate-binding protein